MLVIILISTPLFRSYVFQLNPVLVIHHIIIMIQLLLFANDVLSNQYYIFDYSTVFISILICSHYIAN